MLCASCWAERRAIVLSPLLQPESRDAAARGTYRAFSDLQFDINFTNGSGCRNFWRKPSEALNATAQVADLTIFKAKRKLDR